jgi:Fe-S-cluster containining protein
MEKKPVTCENCNGMCCKYVTVAIEGPKTVDDLEEIRWLLSHKKVMVYMDEEDDWFVEFQTECKYLDEKNRCMIYPHRSSVCSDHSHHECDFNEDEFDHKLVFTELDDFDGWASKTEIGRKAQELRQKRS